jgi:hypothetical protein
MLSMVSRGVTISLTPITASFNPLHIQFSKVLSISMRWVWKDPCKSRDLSCLQNHIPAQVMDVWDFQVKKSIKMCSVCETDKNTIQRKTLKYCKIQTTFTRAFFHTYILLKCSRHLEKSRKTPSALQIPPYLCSTYTCTLVHKSWHTIFFNEQ